MSSLNFNYESGAPLRDTKGFGQELNKLPEEPKELLKQFEEICSKKNEWDLNKTNQIDAIFTKITVLNDTGKLKPWQAKKIAKLSASIYPSISNIQTQGCIRQFLQQTLSQENVNIYLKINEAMRQTAEILDELANFKPDLAVQDDHCVDLSSSAAEFKFNSSQHLEALKKRIRASVQEFSELIDKSHELNDRISLSQIKEHVENTAQKLTDNPHLLKDNFTEEEQGSLKKQMESIADRVSDHYLDEYRLLKGAPGDKPIHPAYQQWFMTQAILQEKGENLDAAQKKHLEQLMLQAFIKAAGRPEAESQKAQSSPLFSEELGYHRDTAFKITKRCYQAYAEKLGFKEELFVVDSPLLMEALTREMPDRGGFTFLHLNQAADLFANLAGYLAKDPSSNFPLLIDISTLMKNEGIAPSELKTVMESLENKFTEVMASKGYPDSLKSEILNRIQFVSFVSHEGQDILLVPAFFNKANASKKIEDIIIATGYRLSPAQILEAWLKIEDAKTIFKRENIPQATLATKGTTIPIVCENYGKLIQQNVFQQFAALSDVPEAASYILVLAKSTSDLVRGLSEYNIDESYPEEMKDLLQLSYFRMLTAMHEAILRKDNYIEFHNQLEIIHQELQGILSVAEPYQEGDFAETVMNNLQRDPAIIPQGLNVKVHLKNSGMHAMASVIAGVEAQKGTQSLNTMRLYDSYFENSGLLKSGQDYCTHVLRTEGVITESLVKGDSLRAMEPIDLFICEFHHNICEKRAHYGPENITSHVKHLKEKGRLAQKCTVVIDTTINLDHADNVRSFLADPDILEMIKKGQLNVVLLRSAQKFDMLGLDNYYGGITATINNGTFFDKFDARMDHQQDQLKGLNYQGLTHLQKYGDLDSYRKAINENTKKFYGMLPEKLLNAQPSVIKIAQMEEESLYFLSIMFSEERGWRYISNAFLERLRQFAKEHQLPLTTRASFGFANTNLSQVSPTLFRLNPGLDDDATLELYALFFKKLANVVEEAMQEQLDEDEIPALLYQRIKSMPIHL